MALNMNYASDVLYNAGTVLYNIKVNGGMLTGKFLTAEATRLQGQRAADSINIALVALGKAPAFEGQATETQMTVLVERAKKENALILREIADLRAAKGK